ncbi:hypothetical protein G5I_03709 [Acromyrmex echinatior]|uniref:Uncharacterized protein n=1 Tax=Acromyrmex echinatior TaxID=103372 RepID=F4WDQ1_ACREC|nr:hypothetical protein G5I_03709 [Acromyrmex echinatior]
MDVNRVGSQSDSVSLGSTPVEVLRSSLGQEGFPQDLEERAHGLKKRRGLVECNLDDRLSSSQKTAVEEVTGFFPQMSPKSVVAEMLCVFDIADKAERRTQKMNGALRRQIKVDVNVAKIAMQRLVSDIAKCSEPSDEIRANNFALERQVIRLRRKMDMLRRERISLRDQDLATDDVTRKTGVGNLSPVYRPLLGRVRKRLDDVPPLLTRVDRSGRVIVDSSRIASDDRPDSRVDKPRTGTVRGGSGMAAADALRVDVPWFEGRVAPSCCEGILVLRSEDCGGFAKMCGDRGQIRNVVKLARGKISLKELNIVNTRIRKAQTGGLLIEIPGDDETGAKAETLLDRLKAVLAESDYKDKVNVMRPVRRAEADGRRSVCLPEHCGSLYLVFPMWRERRAAGCRLPPHYPVYASRGLAARHRAGAPECVPLNGRGQVPVNEDLHVDNVVGTSAGIDRGAPVLADEGTEIDTGDVAVSELNHVPDSDRWLASTNIPPSTAVTWQWSRSRVPCSPRWRGTRFAAVDWGIDVIVVSCYFSHSLCDVEFLRDLRELEVKLTGVK